MKMRMSISAKTNSCHRYNQEKTPGENPGKTRAVHDASGFNSAEGGRERGSGAEPALSTETATEFTLSFDASDVALSVCLSPAARCQCSAGTPLCPGGGADP